MTGSDKTFVLSTLLIMILLPSSCSGGSDDSGPSGPLINPAPLILGLDPQPVRAGELISIRGEDFALGNSFRVFLDGLPVPVESSTASSATARIPLRTVPGTHGLQVVNGDKASQEVDTLVSIFTVTGLYDTEARVSNAGDCASDPVQNATEHFAVSLTDSRPSISISVRGFHMSGNLFEVGAISAFESSGTSATTFNVSLGTFEDGTAGLSGEFRYLFVQGAQVCQGFFDLTGRRRS